MLPSLSRVPALVPIMISFLLGAVECSSQSVTDETLSQPILPANTPVILRLKKNLYKKDAKPGQPVEFELGSDVVVNGQVVIERGAAVNASVRQVDRTGKGPAKVLIDLGHAQTISGETARLAPTQVPSNWSSADFMPIIPVFLVVRLFQRKVLLDKDAGCGLFDLRQTHCGVWVAARVAENVALDPEKLTARQAQLHEAFLDSDASMFSCLGLTRVIAMYKPFLEPLMNGQVNASVSRPLLSLLATAGCLDAAGDLDGAIEEYRQAIALKPDSPELRVLLAGVFQKKGEFDHAIEQLQQAVALKPDSSEVHVSLAKLFQEKGDFVHAIAEYRTAVAIGEYRTAVQLDPKDEHTREGFVTFLVESDDPDAALAEIKEAMRIWPDNIYFHYLLGRLLVKKNDPDAGIVELQWALKKWKNHSWQASCALGSAYELKGDLNAALGQYRTANRVHMDDEKCRAGYERLRRKLKK